MQMKMRILTKEKELAFSVGGSTFQRNGVGVGVQSRVTRKVQGKGDSGRTMLKLLSSR